MGTAREAALCMARAGAAMRAACRSPAPVAGMATIWDDAAGQVVPAEHIDLKLGAEHLGSEILDGTGLTVAAIVEERDKLSVRCRQNFVCCLCDRLRLGIIEIEALEAPIVQARNVLRLARRGEDAPAARLHLARRRQAYPRGAAGDED